MTPKLTFVRLAVVAWLSLIFSTAWADTPGAWRATGSMATSRRATGVPARLPDGRILVVGGADTTGVDFSATIFHASAEIYDPAIGIWSTTGSLTTGGRVRHQVRVLANGKVLVTGGWNGTAALASAELYNPATGNFSATGTMTIARAAHTATVLDDGRVLIAGGVDSAGNPLASAELYNPATGLFAPTTAGMAQARYRHSETLLSNGKVLIAGGFDAGGVALASAELFNPVTGTFSPAGSMAHARGNHRDVALPVGSVLLTGGNDGSGPLTSSELFDPDTNAFTQAASLNHARQFHTASLAPNGQVLIIGGNNHTSTDWDVQTKFLSSVELYDPLTNNMTLTGSLSTARSEISHHLLWNGKVLATGGGSNTAELYTPLMSGAPDNWVVTGSLITPRTGHQSVLLDDGRTLIFGGSTGSTTLLASAELYDYVTGLFTQTGSMADVREQHRSTLLPNGKVLVAGGRDVNGVTTGAAILNSAELFDPVTGVFSPTGSMNVARRLHRITNLTTTGKVLVSGGVGSTNNVLSSVELYDPDTRTFTNTGNMIAARRSHTAVRLTDGKVLIIGGAAAGTVPLSSCELYDPATGFFSPTGSMATPRISPNATRLPNGKVLVFGGTDNPGNPILSAEIYDPASGSFSPAGTPGTARDSNRTTLLDNGQLLTYGGVTTNQAASVVGTAEVYDFVTNSFEPAASMIIARQDQSSTSLPNGLILAVGGVDADNNPVAAAELYTPFIGETPPDTTIESAVTSNTSATFTFTSSESPSTFLCSLDGAPVTPCVAPKIYNSLADGSHTFLVAAVDTLGNVDQSPASHTWSITDTTPPETTIILAPPATTTGTSASFRFLSNETGTFSCSLDGAPFTTCTSPQDYIGLTLGAHNFQVRAHDSAGSIDATPASRDWTIIAGVAPPDTAIISKPPQFSNSTSATFTFDSTEAGSTFTCSLDGAPFTTCINPQIYNGLANGDHYFQVTATGASANTDPSPAFFAWTIDTVPSETTITSAPPLFSNSTSATFSFTSPQAASTFECKLDAGLFVACTSPQTYSSLADGLHTFQVRAIDAANNADPTPASYTWTIDTVAPNTTITSTPAASTNNRSATFVFTSTEAGSTFECKLDGAAFAVCTTPKAYTGLATGAHTFQVRAIDAAGNVDLSPASFPWTITVDAVAPNTTITAAPLGSTNSTTATFTFASTEGSSTFRCSLDGAPFTACVSPKIYNELANSSHNFQVTATDVATNTDATPAIYNWTINTNAPNLRFAKQSSGTNGDQGYSVAGDNFGNSYVTGFFQGTATFGAGELNQTILTSAGLDDIFIAKYDVNGFLIWAKKAGGVSGNDRGYGIAVDASGNSYVIGSYQFAATFGAGETNQTTLVAVLNDIFIAKFDVSGALQWAKQAGGVGTDAGYSIAADSLGNSYVTGFFQGSATFGAGEVNATTLVAAGSDDIFIAKYDTSGLLQWTKRAGGTGTDDGNGIAVDSSGNSYVTGVFQGSATFGAGDVNETTLVSSGGNEIFVAKYNVSGALQWAKRAGGTISDFAYSVGVDGLGNSYVTGLFEGSATFGQGEVNQTILTTVGGNSDDVFVAKYDGSGALQWAKRGGGTGFDDGYGIAVDNLGNSVVTGTFQGSATFGLGEPNQATVTTSITGSTSAAFLAMYDPSGALQWIKQVGGAGFSAGVGAAVDSLGKVYATGYFGGTTVVAAGEVNQTTLTAPTSNHTFVARFGTSGDNTSPELLVTSHSNNQTVTTTPITLSGTASDAGLGDNGISTVTANGVPATGGTASGAGTANWSQSVGLNAGANLIAVVAADASANTNSTTRQININFSPTVTIAATTASASETGPTAGVITVTRTGSTTSALTVNYTVSGTATSGSDYVPLSGSAVILTGQSSAQIVVTPIDDAILESAETVIVTITPNAAYTVGAQSSATVTIADNDDIVPPETTINTGPANPTNSTSATFAFTSTEPGTFACSLDGGAFTACTSPQSYSSLTDGSHTFQVVATDLAGNTDPTPASFSWTINAIAPDTIITVAPPATSSSTSATFEFTSTEAGGVFSCALDGAPFSQCTSPVTYDSLASGSHTFQVVAIDSVGNVDPTAASFTWTIDNVVPDTTITSGPENPTNSTSAMFAFTSDDPTAAFECSLDGGAYSACTTSQAYDGLAAGNHTFEVRAKDVVGNVDPTPASFTWVIDNVAPDTNITSAPPAVNNSTTATFEFTSAEAGSTFECQLDNQGFVGCTSPTTYTDLLNGSHVFQVRAKDALNNSDPTPASYTWTVDNALPNGTFLWTKRAGAGGTSDDAAYGIVADSAANSYVTGSFQGSATFGLGEANPITLISAGASDFFVAKYNSNGGAVWVKQAGGGSADGTGRSIAIDGSGNSYVTGEFSGTLTFGTGEPNETTLTASGFTDIFVANYNSTGALQWVKRAGGVVGSDEGGGEGIAMDSSGLVYVTGFFEGSVKFGAGEANETTLSGGRGGFVAKYTSSGVLQWAKGTDAAPAHAIAVDSSANSYVTGSFFGTATFGAGEPNQTTFTSGDNGNADEFFIAKYNSDGLLQWAKRAAGESDMGGEGIAVDGLGNSYVTGSFGVTATFASGELSQVTIASAGDYDIFIAKYDSSGSFVWAQRAGGTGIDQGFAITADGSGHIHVTGQFQGSATFNPGQANETTLASTGGGDIFVAQYDSNGVLQSVAQAGSTLDIFANGIALDGSGNVYVAGDFRGSATFGLGTANQSTLTSAGSGDIYIAKFSGGVISPAVTIVASIPTASEGGATGEFTVSRTGNTTAPLTVNYTVGGTATSGSDYTALAGSVVIPAGQSSATIALTPVDDDVVESDETVIVTLATNNAYVIGLPNSATATILDNDFVPPTVTIAATVSPASENGTTGEFTVSRTGSTTAPLTVNYSVGGTATSGSDYTALSGSVVIPAGQSSAPITVTPIDDITSEDNETVVVTLIANASYLSGSPDSATVTILDNDRPSNDHFANAQTISGVSGTVSGTNVGATKEAGEPDHGGNTGGASVWYRWTAPKSGMATVTTSGSSFDTLLGVYTGNVVNSLSMVASNDDAGGFDFTSGVTFSATAGTIYQIAVDGYEGDSRNLTLNWALTYLDAINPNPFDFATLPGSFAISGFGFADTGFGLPRIIFTRGGVILGEATATSVSNTSLAVPVPGFLTASATPVTVEVYNQTSGGLVQVGSTTLTVNDTRATVSVVATSSTASEMGSRAGVFTVSRTGNTAAPLTVNYTVGGTAKSGRDFTPLSGSVVIPAGQSSAPVTVTPINDAVLEGNETVVVRLTANAAYIIGSPNSAVVTILDSNDNFSIAKTISGDSGTVNGTNVGATKEPGEPDHGGNTGGASVWYRWTAPKSGMATVTTSGSGFDTLLGVYTGNAVNSLTTIASNDDAGGFDFTSSVTFSTVAGTIYQIAVDGYEGDSGNLTLNWAFTYVDTISPNPLDLAALPGSLTIGGLGFTDTGFGLPQVKFTRAGVSLGQLTATAMSNTSLTVPVPGFLTASATPVTVEVYNQASAGLVLVGTTTLTVNDTRPAVSVVATSSTASENGLTPGVFTVSRTGSTAASLTVNYTVGGTAKSGRDFTPLSGSVLIPGGQSSTQIVVTPIDDTAVEAAETIIVTLTANAAYALGAQNSATVTITDNDVPDTTPPDTNITSAPPAVTNSTTAPFEFTSTEVGSTFECKLDNDSFASCTSTKTYMNLADGAHTFQVRAIDAAHNTDQTPASYSWVIDIVPPETTITSTPAANTNSTGASFQFTSDDPTAAFECKLDSAATFSACTSPYSYSGLGGGSHNFQVRAFDSAGNFDTTPASHNWTIDITAPDTTITTAPPALTNSTSATFEFTSTEAGSSFSCALDGGGFSACTSPNTYNGLAGGSHTFEVVAIDSVGNVDPTSASFTWTIDNVAPDTTLTSNPPAVDSSTTATFEFTSTEAGSALECSLDGQTFATCTSPQTYTNLLNGPHTFQVRAKDAANNIDPAAASYSWRIQIGARNYTYTSLTTSAFGVASINNLGQVAYQRRVSNGTTTTTVIFKHDGVAGTEFYNLTSNGLTGSNGSFAINDNGAVALLVQRDSGASSSICPSTNPFGDVRCLIRINPDQTVTLLATQNNVGGSGTFAEFSSSPSMNNSGQVAIGVRRTSDGVNQVVRIDGPGQVAEIFTQTATLYNPSWVSINDAGVVAFSAQEPQTPGVCSGFDCTSVYTGSGGTLTNEGRRPGGGNSSWGPIINNAGLIIDTGVGSPALIYTAQGGVVNTLVNGNENLVFGNISSFVGPNQNDLGKFVFGSHRIGFPTDFGVFIGNDPNVHTVVRMGDSLFGGIVGISASGPSDLWIRASQRYINNFGQIVLSITEFVGDSQTTHVVLATPINSDTTPPETNIVFAPPPVSDSTVATFQFTATETGIFQCKLDGGAFEYCSSPKVYTNLAEGAHSFQVRGVDMFGNTDQSPAVFSWTIDVTPPETNITSAPAALTSSTSATFEFASNEAGTFECNLDSVGYTLCATGQNYAGLANGGHTFQVRAVDLAGNFDTTSVSYSWTIDAAAPDTTITSAPAALTNSSSATFAFMSTEAGSSFSCALDSAGFSVCTTPNTYDGVASGSHTFQVRATDLANNTDETAAGFTWTIDIAAPDTSLTSNLSALTNSTSASFTFTSTEAGSTFECRLDADGFAACASPQTYNALADGDHNFQVQATDPAGNTDPSPDSFSWAIQ